MAFRKLNFKQEYPYERRKELADKILTKFTDRIPIIILYSDVPLKRRKYLVPRELTAVKVMIELRNRMIEENTNLDPSQALYLLTEKNTMLVQTEPIESIYDKYQADDGFLYLQLKTENVFGK